uniref:Right handed beta helix domain-containing protein n=1 Tax=Amphimedon queenslandica TaxID=400682 RepID=A0A1X7V9R2_AMPQE
MLLLLFLFILSSTSAESINRQEEGYYMYVLPSSSRQSSCPPQARGSNSTCGTLSMLVSRLPPTASNISFIFLDGVHLLHDYVHLKEIPLVRLKSISPSMQPVLVCTGDSSGFDVVGSRRLEISGIAVTNCTSPFGLYDIAHVSIINAVMHDNKGIAVFIADTVQIVIENTKFIRNGLISNESCGHMVISSHQSAIYCSIRNTIFTRGIGYYSGLTLVAEDSYNVSILIHNTTSTNNTSVGSRGSANINIYVINSIINEIQFFQVSSTNGTSVQDFDSQGGGLYLSLNRLTCTPESKITINNSFFAHNYARTGSGAFLYFGGTINCKFLIENSSFINNGHYIMFNDKLQVCTEGGGLEIDDYANTTNNSVIIENSKFISNGALIGGAFQQATAVNTKLTIINSTFEGNVGFVGSAIVGNFQSDPSIHSNTELIDVLVIGNTRYSVDVMKVFMGSSFSYNNHIRHFNEINAAVILSSDRHPFTVNATNIVIRDNYNISGIALRGCNIRFKGKQNAFINNSSPEIGGGLVILTTNIYFEVNDGNYLTFINNTAQYGGALYIADIGLDDYDISYIDSSYHYADGYYQCSFNTDQKYNQKHDSSNQLVKFINNTASIAGNDAYGGMYRVCNIVPNADKTLSQQLSCPMTRYWSLTSNRSISSLPFAVCACNESIVDCNIRHLNKSLYPGQSFNLSLVTVGSCEGISPGPIVSYISGGNLSTSVSDQMTSTSCKNLTYFVTSKKDIAYMTVSAARSQYEYADLSVYIDFKSCPVGFEQSNDNGTCVCSKTIRNKVTCDINNEEYPFTRAGANWIAYDETHNCFVAQEGCPFDYCRTDTVSFSATDPSTQCALNRTGRLCGKCQPGLSVVLGGSNACQHCTNMYLLLLLPVFLILGILFIGALIFFDLTVASGRINGLLLYINTVKMNESVFFPLNGNPVLKQFIAWLNLDLGIDLCFYNGLDAYWQTWLQFAFPFYLWILSIGMIISSRHSIRLSRLFGRNAVPVLATLLLISYSKILSAIKDVFMYETLSCYDNELQVATKWSVWSLDATINYFSMKRIPIIIFSALLLLAALLYTSFLTSMQWLQQYSYKYCCRGKRDPLFRLKPFIDAYCGPYKDKYRYWTGLLLLTRLLLTSTFWFTSSIDRANSIVLIVAVLLLLSLAVTTNGMYTRRYLNALEIGFIVNIGLISLGSLATNNRTTISILSNISIAVAALVLTVMMGIVIIKKPLLWMKRKKHIKSSDTVPLLDGVGYSDDGSPPGSPANLIRRRESLIFDIDMANLPEY